MTAKIGFTKEDEDYARKLLREYPVNDPVYGKNYDELLVNRLRKERASAGVVAALDDVAGNANNSPGELKVGDDDDALPF
jgi:hypothetical protein